MFRQIHGYGLFGLNAFPVTAEISITKGMPIFEIVGLPDAAVQESRHRIRSAMKVTDLPMPLGSVVVNLSPASVKKSGSLFDFTIFVAILAAQGYIDADISKTVFIGEVSLGGAINPIHGALTIAIAAQKQGMEALFLPKENAREASAVEGISIYGVEHIAQILAHFSGKMLLKKEPPFKPAPVDYSALIDFSNVKGQENAKQALEVAAAGFHNILMIGTPGTGKSMLAKRIPTILPAMSFSESLETTQVYSVAGLLDIASPLIVKRPFRAISHTASAAGLIGGGSIPKPGEISLAHNGVLFLDELPEFDRKTLETLRQPLEDGEIHITRTSGKACYPCSIMLIAAMNPCPCGNFGHPKHACTCTEKQVRAYLGKISQPVLDRIDIQVEVAPVSYDEISDSGKSESSASVRSRVENARQIQYARYRQYPFHHNAQIPSGLLHEMCPLDKAGADLLRNAFDRLGISARAYDRILKVARTIADLDNAKQIEKRHIARAIQYRSLDKKYWQK